MHDDELVLRLQRGDEWTFQLLVRRFRRRIFAIAFGITLDAKESQVIVQDVFLQAYRSIGEYRGDASLTAWLHRITVNRCLNWRHRWSNRFKWLHGSGKSPASTVGEPGADLPSPARQAAGAHPLQQIDAVLRALPEQARAIVVLRELESLSCEAIAEATGIKPATVRSRLFNARRQLKAMLEPPPKVDE